MTHRFASFFELCLLSLVLVGMYTPDSRAQWANGQAADAGPPTAFQLIVTMLEEHLPRHPTLDDILPYAFAACRAVALIFRPS